MVPIGQDQEHKWAHQQIEAYRQVYPRYAKTAQVLQQILEKATRQFTPQAIIQTRPKSIPSFRESHLQKESWPVQRPAGVHDRSVRRTSHHLDFG